MLYWRGTVIGSLLERILTQILGGTPAGGKQAVVLVNGVVALGDTARSPSEPRNIQDRRAVSWSY